MGIEVSGLEDLQADLEQVSNKLDDTDAALVGASADHAADVEFGTDPHTIEADDAEALHFELDGEEVFVKSVQHPGTEPQPFLRPAKRHIEANAEQYLEEAENTSDLVRIAAVEAVRKAKQEAPVDDGDLQNSIRWEFV